MKTERQRKALALLREKIDSLLKTSVLETDPSLRFKLEQELKDAERQEELLETSVRESLRGDSDLASVSFGIEVLIEKLQIMDLRIMTHLRDMSEMLFEVSKKVRRMTQD